MMTGLRIGGRLGQGIIALALIVALSACGESAPSRFYLLSTMPPSAGSAAAPRAIALGVGPIQMPRHLDRAQIVSFTSSNQLQLAEFDRWAEPLTENVARVLGQNLAILVPAERVMVYPWTGPATFDYQVIVEFSNFETTPTRMVSLRAQWNIVSSDGRRIVKSGRVASEQVVASQSVEATVAAMSRALGDLSTDVAEAVKALPPRAAPR
jgi:uncharacterized protein